MGAWWTHAHVVMCSLVIMCSTFFQPLLLNGCYGHHILLGCPYHLAEDHTCRLLAKQHRGGVHGNCLTCAKDAVCACKHELDTNMLYTDFVNKSPIAQCITQQGYEQTHASWSTLFMSAMHCSSECMKSCIATVIGHHYLMCSVCDHGLFCKTTWGLRHTISLPLCSICEQPRHQSLENRFYFSASCGHR